MKLETRPCDEGYRLTADFERQSASYIIWPERPDNWRDGAKPAQQTFAKLAEMIGEWENQLPKEIHLAYLPVPGLVKLRMSCTAETQA